MNFLLKTFDRRDRKPNFVIFVVWNALIVSEWVVLAWRESLIWSRLKSHLMCYWLHSRIGDAGLVQDFIFLFWMLIKGMWRRVKLIYLKELVKFFVSTKFKSMGSLQQILESLLSPPPQTRLTLKKTASFRKLLVVWWTLLYKKQSIRLRISPFGHISWRNPSWKTSFFV